MVKQTEAIGRFLKAKTHADLATLYSPDMEVQVLVSQGRGERIDKEYKGSRYQCYSDGVQTWAPIRIPRNANTEPEYDEERIMTFDLEAHAEGIGMTGWDWKNKQSKWVGFDFDALIGHSDKHSKRLTEEELNEITTKIRDIPFVTIRKSTGGRGLHLYVFLDPPVPTSNHNEHSALARAILSLLCQKANFDFQAKVDCCGSVLWQWHTKLAKDGLKLVKQGCALDKVPNDWQSHLSVIKQKRQKPLPSFINNQDLEQERLFEELSGQRTRIKLEPRHHELIKYLEENQCFVSWDADRNMLVTHTSDLKAAHQALNMKGFFDTISEGTEQNDRNCFMFPIKAGAWTVRRFTQGVAEKSTWYIDNSGYTTCYFNREPDLATASRYNEGMQDKKGFFIFNDARSAVKTATDLGITRENFPSDESVIRKKAKMSTTSKGELVVEIEHDAKSDKADEWVGWINDKKLWQKVFFFRSNTNQLKEDISIYDEDIRHLSSEEGENLGWCIKTETGWRDEPLAHVEKFLSGEKQYDAKMIKTVLGSNIVKPWIMVAIPFQDEYIGGRKWNRFGARFNYIPNPDIDNLSFPHWTKILEHFSRSLDEAVKENEFCKKNAIVSGLDYIRVWIASVFKEPYQPLPYLFAYGSQNSGKSIFHEALSLLLTRGYVRADNALSNASGFNGELIGAIIAVVEEIDLKKDKTAYNRLKDWVTAIQLPIHPKHETPYTVPNTCHFVQTSNELINCPVFPNDTRVTVIHVGDLESEIPKHILIQELKKEAPDFLASILGLELPVTIGRLNLPVLKTRDKEELEDSNLTILERFIKEKCFYIPGEVIALSEFFEEFKAYVALNSPQEVSQWSIIRVGRELPINFPKGRMRGGDANFKIGNMSFQEKVSIGPRWIRGEKEYIVTEHKVTG